MAIIGGILGSVAANSGGVGSLLSGSDPKKDEERKARARNYRVQAEAGSAEAEARLRCMAGEMTELAVSMGILDERGGCSLAGGSDVGRNYAKQQVAQLDAYRAAEGIKTAVGEGLVKAGSVAAGTGANILGPVGTAKVVAENIPVWVWVLGAAALGFVVVRAIK